MPGSQLSRLARVYEGTSTFLQCPNVDIQLIAPASGCAVCTICNGVQRPDDSCTWLRVRVSIRTNAVLNEIAAYDAKLRMRAKRDRATSSLCMVASER